MNPVMNDVHPVGIVVNDDLRRSRLTVFFRLLLVIPHVIWVLLWSVLVVLLALVAWVLTLVLGRLPVWLHGFFCSYIRYVAHVAAYITLVANPFPFFTGAEGSYPVDIRLPSAPVRQGRWRTLFRSFLSVPAVLMSSPVGGGGVVGTGFLYRGFGLSGFVGFLGWFASVVRGRMPEGLRDAGAYAIGYRAQLLAYVLFVTDRYPNTDPSVVLEGLVAPPLHPVRLAAEPDDLRRSRVTALFRLPLLIPHLVWLYLWSVLVDLVVIVQWFVTLVRGRPIGKLHAFVSRYVRYSFHVAAFGTLTANPFPGFTGRPGSYPLDLVLPDAGRQSRWKTLFRFLLALPTFFVLSALYGIVLFDAILVWVTSLVLGRSPRGLRNLSAYCLRYGAQVSAYIFLLTDAYPNACPLEGSDPPVEAPAEPESVEPAEQAA